MVFKICEVTVLMVFARCLCGVCKVMRGVCKVIVRYL